MEQEQETELEQTPKRGINKTFLTLLIVVFGVLCIGMVGQLAGAGFFGYRTWMYEGGALYVLNFEQEGLQVTVDSSVPKPVPFENAKIFDLLGGTSKINLLDKKGAILKKYEVTAENSHVFIKRGKDTCLIVLDMSGYYRKDGEKKLAIVKRLGKKDELFVPQSTNVIWPRNSFPTIYKPSSGKLYWFEKVACEMLDPEEEHLLLSYMNRRLIDRMNRQKKMASGNVKQTL